MHAFIVRLPNRPGSLADLGDALGERGINITGISGMTWGDGDGALAIITNDESGARSVLEERNDDYREVSLVSASLEDRPGSLGDAARRLASRDVNIEAVIPTGMQGSRITVALGVDDESAAREALGDLAAMESKPVA
ncbi:MAG TPA: ACT domain-containing protein [Candidatus Limnocylindria bacterium]|nr:ACT domain-containing protein [Candidatus Limnocylindria bacterium]